MSVVTDDDNAAKNTDETRPMAGAQRVVGLMNWARLVRSLTAEYEDEAGAEDDEGLRCESCGKQIADKILSTGSVRPISTTCKGCSNPSYFGSNGHPAGV